MKRFLAIVVAVGVLAAPLQGQYRPPIVSQKPSDVAPPVLKEVGVDQKLGDQVPLDVPFYDENGREVTLRDYMGEKPVILSLVYYGCPMLCGQILNGLTGSLRMLSMDPGKDFKVVTISFDPREKPELASEKKTNYLKQYKHPDAAANWHWLTGPAESSKAVADAVGFRYTWDEKFEQYAHGSAIMVLTPEGKVSRYFYGIMYSPKDMRLGLTEASSGRVGGLAEQIMLFCYHYDATQGKYTMLTFRLIQVGGLITLLALGSFLFIMFRRDYRASRLPKVQESGL